MDTLTLDSIYAFWQNAVQAEDWKDALDLLVTSLRQQLVFDNLAIYTVDDETYGDNTQIAYARAVGREKQAEADASWGEDIAARVLENDEIITQFPDNPEKSDARVEQAYLIGLPLKISGKLIGALVFVRFGGPRYTAEQARIASLAAIIVAYIFEKRALQENIAQLETAQRQMRLQDDFVSTMSHELRTPLGFIKGYSTTLLREDTEWDESTRREFLTIIDEETDHLTELIENILESARLESKTAEMNFQPIRIDALVRDVITRVIARHKGIEIIFNTACESPIHGDSTRLAQVFENLFSNAIKYAPKAKITIDIDASEKFLRTRFCDNGKGIPQDHLPYIFDRFYRVPGNPRNTGTGLGLFICKRIIDAHHGKIWAESIPDQGTTFFIDLPIK